MSTNAYINIEGAEYVTVYKHWDGDPEGTLQWLEDFNRDFAENLGDDPSYKVAQLLRDSERSAEKYHLDRSKHTGWGVYGYMDEKYLRSERMGGYLYTLKSDGSVTVTDLY